MTEAFGMNIGTPTVDALSQLVGLQQTISETANQQGGFQSTLIFGDWITVGRMFVNFFTGGYAVGMLHLLSVGQINFPPIFILGISALSAVSLVWGFMYLISGRGTKQSD